MLWILPTESMPLRWQSSLVHTHTHTRNSTTSSLLWVISDPVLFLYTAVPKINRNLLLVRLIHQKKKKKRELMVTGVSNTRMQLSHMQMTHLWAENVLSHHIYTHEAQTHRWGSTNAAFLQTAGLCGEQGGFLFVPIDTHFHTLSHQRSIQKHNRNSSNPLFSMLYK